MTLCQRWSDCQPDRVSRSPQSGSFSHLGQAGRSRYAITALPRRSRSCPQHHIGRCISPLVPRLSATRRPAPACCCLTTHNFACSLLHRRIVSGSLQRCIWQGGPLFNLASSAHRQHTARYPFADLLGTTTIPASVTWCRMRSCSRS